MLSRHKLRLTYGARVKPDAVETLEIVQCDPWSMVKLGAVYRGMGLMAYGFSKRHWRDEPSVEGDRRARGRAEISLMRQMEKMDRQDEIPF